jgi:hypothetical protein
MSDEEKSHELINLCEQLFYDEASFDDIQQWLENNKDNQDLLIQAANYQDEKYNYTPLHYLVMKKPPSDLVKGILRLAPDTVEVKDKTYERLPLHWALWSYASDDVINFLLDAYPQAAGIEDSTGDLPLSIAQSLHASDNIIKMLIEAQDQLNRTLPRPTKNSWWNFWDEQIYIDNKTKFTLKLIVYYKAEKVEAPEDFEMLHVEPKEKKLLKIKKINMGIYCDILCDDKFGTSSKLGWALNYFIEKGFTQEVIGIPKELKQTMEPIVVAKFRSLRTESLLDFDVTAPKVIEKSKEVIISPIAREREPIAETLGDTIRSKGLQREVAVSEKIKESNERDSSLFSVVTGKQNTVPQFKYERETSTEEIVEVLGLDETLEPAFLQVVNAAPSEGFNEKSNLLHSGAILEVIFAYYFLKKIPITVNDSYADADEFYHSLQDHLLNIELSSSYLDLMIDELNEMEGHIVDWKKYDKNTFAAKVQFTLEALSNTCKERFSMQKSIQQQDELVEQLFCHSSRSNNNNEYTAAFSIRSDETNLPADYKNSAPEVQLAYYFLKKAAAAVNYADADEFYHSLQDHLLNIELSSSNLDLMMDELKGMEGYIVNWKINDLNTFAAKVQFTLEALTNTCNERLSMQDSIQLQDKLVSVLSTGNRNAFTPIGNSNVDEDLSDSEENIGSDGKDNDRKNNNNSGGKDASWNFREFLNEVFQLNYINIKNMTEHNIYAHIMYIYPSHQSLKWNFKFNLSYCSAGAEAADNANSVLPKECSDTVKPDEKKKFIFIMKLKVPRLRVRRMIMLASV